MDMFTLIVVMVSQVYVYAQTHHIACIKDVYFLCINYSSITLQKRGKLNLQRIRSLGLFGVTVDELLKRLEKKPFVEVSDTGAYYFVNAMSLLKKGETMPVDMASAEIRTLLINSSKANFIKKVKRDLFDQAIESEEIKIYDNAFSSLLGEGESANQ